MSINKSANTDRPLVAGEAIGYTTTALCEVIPSDSGYAVILWLNDDEMLVAEMWPDLPSASGRAEVFRGALVAQDWWLLLS